MNQLDGLTYGNGLACVNNNPFIGFGSFRGIFCLLNILSLVDKKIFLFGGFP